MFAVKGNIISASSFGKLDIYENSYLVVDEKIVGIYKELPKEYQDIEVRDYKDKLIFQSFSDMHLHAPQYPMVGLGMDLPLLDWLKTYTFPLEAKFSDTEYARIVYKSLAKELIKNGTTRVAMFSSLHREATIILMEELEKAGITGFVGKVNMDRNGGVNLQENTTESIEETRKWINEAKFKNLKPIITPRFIPSCTPELLKELGKIAQENNLGVQSHLSENLGEIAFVKELEPDTNLYWEAYNKYGLWNDKTLMAHCVYSNDEELNAIKDAGVYVVHCAASNENIISGHAPIRKMLDMGVKVVLGSDIAGGDKISMFDNIVETINVSKSKSIIDKWQTKFLTVKEAFYLATSAANVYFDEKPGFAMGNEFNAIVLDDSYFNFFGKLDVEARFERAIYRRSKDAISCVYANGKLVYEN